MDEAQHALNAAKCICKEVKVTMCNMATNLVAQYAVHYAVYGYLPSSDHLQMLPPPHADHTGGLHYSVFKHPLPPISLPPSCYACSLTPLVYN